MSFNYNPYEPKLNFLFEKLSDQNVRPDQIDTDCLFEFSDPIAAIPVDKIGEIPARVAIIGGGIAGLTAAYEFLRLAKKFGKPEKICIFEKTARLGGRILTHHFNSSAYAELGPMRLPAYHKIALHYVDELGVGLYTFPTQATYHFSRVANTQACVKSEEAGVSVADAYKQFAAGMDYPPLNFFFPPESGSAPSIDSMERKFLTGFEESFFPQGGLDLRRNISTMIDLFANRPLSDWGRVMEGFTVREGFIRFMEFRVQKASEIRFGQEFGQEKIAACAAHLWELYGRATGQIWLEHISMAHFLREAKGFAGDGVKFAIAGGFGRLVDAFVHQLKADQRVTIRLRQGVIGVKSSATEVKLHLTSPRDPDAAEDFDAVVCAAPASAVARINFDPSLSPDKQNALSSISYLAASKSAALFRERFWELSDQSPQLGGVMYTDLENQQIWYPHDNIIYGEDDAGPDVPVEGAPPRRVERQRNPDRVRDPGISRRPGALLAAYMWGENARRFASLTNNERDDHIIRCLETVHPGSSKQLIDLVHWPWDAQTNPGGGAFAWYQPGQQSRYQEAATRPHPISATGTPKVFFAGEHLGLIQGWIQAAMLTALDAVMRACGGRFAKY